MSGCQDFLCSREEMRKPASAWTGGGLQVTSLLFGSQRVKIKTRSSWAGKRDRGNRQIAEILRIRLRAHSRFASGDAKRTTIRVQERMHRWNHKGESAECQGANPIHDANANRVLVVRVIQ